MRISEVNAINNIGNVGNAKGSSTTSGSSSINEAVETQIDATVQMKNDKAESDQVVIDDEMLEKAVEQANKSLENYNRHIERSVHEKTKAIMYVMKDSKTDEVIREFPPKKIQDMIAKMWELAGLFVDEKA
jgi:flagellar protein FlaG